MPNTNADYIGFLGITLLLALVLVGIEQGNRNQSAPPTDLAAIAEAPNIVGNLGRWVGRPFSHTPGDTALAKANHERGLKEQRPVTLDPDLHALALAKATYAAERRIKGHIGGSMGTARCEGVGHTNGRFLTCCLDTPGTHGGAAMVEGLDGWYCCFLLR